MALGSRPSRVGPEWPFILIVVFKLRRGREIVTDIFSAFGDLRETRLTGALGFLVAKAPYAFGRLFLNGSSISEDVMIEEPEDQSRYDVVIRTKTRLIVIEAKLGYIGV